MIIIVHVNYRSKTREWAAMDCNSGRILTQAGTGQELGVESPLSLRLAQEVLNDRYEGEDSAPPPLTVIGTAPDNYQGTTQFVYITQE